MAPIADDVVGGFNEYLVTQQEVEEPARLTLVQFDSRNPFDLVHDGVTLGEVPRLTRERYQPRGLTPLYDAIGMTLAHVSEDRDQRRSLELPEEDEIFVIVTDGRENTSCEYTRREVFDAIAQRRQEGWAFLFLGANMDAFAEGRWLGFAKTGSAGWKATPSDANRVWRGVSRSQEIYWKKSRAARRAEADEFWKGGTEQ